MRGGKELPARRCGPLARSGARGPAEVRTRLAGRGRGSDCMMQTCRSDDDHRTIAFADALAGTIDRTDRHPAPLASLNRGEMRSNAGSIRATSGDDFIGAVRVDAPYAQRARRRNG